MHTLLVLLFSLLFAGDSKCDRKRKQSHTLKQSEMPDMQMCAGQLLLTSVEDAETGSGCFGIRPFTWFTIGSWSSDLTEGGPEKGHNYASRWPAVLNLNLLELHKLESWCSCTPTYSNNQSTLKSTLKFFAVKTFERNNNSLSHLLILKTWLAEFKPACLEIISVTKQAN